MSPRLHLTPSARPDASMDLLNQILRQPVDPDYAIVADRERRRAESPTDAAPKHRPHLRLAAVAVVIGTLFSLAAVQTFRSRPVATAERAQLITRIKTEDQRQEDLRNRLVELRAGNDQLRRTALAGDTQARQLQTQVDELAPIAGDAPVKGPGVTVIVDDAPVTREDRLNRVLDRDLQQLANGLWSAGAEAVAINGHRLTTRTAIRSAGDAITVDYRSLTRPYRVEAIGDPRRLPAAFAESQGGRLWTSLQQNYQLRFEVSQAKELTLAADPGFGTREARRMP
ncbi:DUF881 domain-containing protein [Enemella evansiae]|uniref:DUF881 domain-containing protein n=1 Tax=Enemella evansiae TaxID=2016499 RepID=UPI001180FE77|nr:DUF881 domain-containing protein [Enemella evansiae]